MALSQMIPWIWAARPKTLWAAFAPVLMGTAMAWEAGVFHWPSAACALAGALLIQIGTNFANDYFDHKKGADTEGRIGPLRVTQAGIIAPETMRNATAVVFAAALVPGAYIVWRGGWPFVVIGLLSILFGVLYTAGPKPLGYVGLADPVVLVFFGPVAVAGTYYAQAADGRIPWQAVVAGLAPGLWSVAILTVNNLRDIDSDRKTGKRTLAVRFGRTFARWEYLGSIMAACTCVPFALWFMTGKTWPLMLCPLGLLAALPIVRKVFRVADGRALNRALAGTGAMLLLFSILFSVAWML